MAFLNPFLQGVKNGFLGSPYFKDYKHASKTFTTNYFGNAPKFKWLFHVYFDIGIGVSPTTDRMLLDNTVNHGILVKNIDLPKFSVSLAEMNQYNRKRFVQTKINYDPIKITFHDDNANQIRHLWHSYYSYYYNDTNQPNGADSSPSPPDVDTDTSKLAKKNTYNADISKEQGYGYIGDYSNDAQALWNGKAPFFKSIRIFGFNQHNFAEYVLVNPIIESFAHDQYDYYSNNGTMEHQMTVRYENVKYYEGAFNGQNPGKLVNRFAESGVYDTELSPINRPGNNKTITGPGGLLDAGLGIVNDLSNQPPNILGALQKAGRLKNTFKNPQAILQTAKTEIVGGVIGAIQNPAAARNLFTFPTPGGQSNPASQNVNNTQIQVQTGPSVSTPANNPIQSRTPFQPPTEPGGA